MAKFARRVFKEAVVCLIPSEHGSGFKEKVLMNVAFRNSQGEKQGESATECLTEVFLGGTNQHTWLLEEGVLTPEQLFVSGTLNSDHWFLSNDLHKKEKCFRVGIATTNKSILFGLPVKSVVEVINMHRPSNWEMSLWRIDFAAFEMAHMLIITNVIQYLQKSGIGVSIRPHPHEYLPNWCRYVKSCAKGVYLDRSLCLEDWLESVSLVISSFSTVSVDSIAHGIPCISLQNIVPRRFVDALPYHKKAMLSEYSWNPQSLDELSDLIDKARSGSLELSPKVEAAQKFMKDNFNFPRNDLACNIIAKEIAAIYESPKCKTIRTAMTFGKNERSVVSFKSRLKSLISRLPLGKYLLLLIRYIHVYISDPRRENLYFPFNISLRRDAKRYTKRLSNYWRSPEMSVVSSEN
jgi:hypothetical protein